MIWIANVLREEAMDEEEHGPECQCSSCIIENGPKKYFVQGPVWHTDEQVKSDLEYLGYVGLYRIRRKPWKTPKTNKDGRKS